MHAARLRAGTTLGRYELVRAIGQGASGVVYEAVHRPLGRRVAVKVLHAASTEAQASSAAERFLREGRAAAQVRHPHVVDVHDFGVEEGMLFLVMELIDGESLGQVLRQRAKLSVPLALEILLPIHSAVAELHTAGIVHRDIKPANILLKRGGHLDPKLADFGVSRIDDESPSITRSGAIIGTPAYMAPELLRGCKAASHRSDQYALAVTLYECITGARPFQGGTDYEVMDAIVRGRARPPSDFERDLARGLDDIVMRAMHRDPERRFGSVDELAEALLPFAAETVSARWRLEFTPPEPISTRERATAKEALGASTPPAARGRAGLLAGAAIATTIAALSALATGARRESPAGVAPAASAGPTARESVPESTVSPPSPSLTAPRETALPGASVSGRAPEAPVRRRAVAPPAPRPAPLPAATPTPAPAIGDNGSPILEVP